MELNIESIQIIKNIIKNQKKFNYASLPNISHFVECYDLYDYTPLEFFCSKNNETKVLEILNTSNFLLLDFEDYHPFQDCCKYLMRNACKKMIQLDIIPKYIPIIEKCISYCFHSKMEDIAIVLFDKVDVQTINPIYIKKNRINPLHYAIRNDLKIITKYLFNYFEPFDMNNETNNNMFLICCKYNNKEYINKIIESKKEYVIPFLTNVNNEHSVYWLLYYKNEDILLNLYHISNEIDKKRFIEYIKKCSSYLNNHKLNKLIEFINKI